METSSSYLVYNSTAIRELRHIQTRMIPSPATLIDDNTAIEVGATSRVHTYVGGGTFTKYDTFDFDEFNNDPEFVYLVV